MASIVSTSSLLGLPISRLYTASSPATIAGVVTDFEMIAWDRPVTETCDATRRWYGSKVGNDGVITVEEGQTFGLDVELTEGMKFENGYVSPYMVSDTEKMEARIADAHILVTDKKITSLKDLLPVLEGLAGQGKRDLVIIAEDVEGDALAGIILNKLKGVLNVLAIKAPGFGDRKKEMLKDIAVLTGATVITEELGYKLEHASVEHLGHAKTVIAKKDNTTIIGGGGDKSRITARVNEIRGQIENTKSEYDREKLAERLAKLA